MTTDTFQLQSFLTHIEEGCVLMACDAFTNDVRESPDPHAVINTYTHETTEKTGIAIEAVTPKWENTPYQEVRMVFRPEDTDDLVTALHEAKIRVQERENNE